MERDESLRMACFFALDVLRAQFGDDLPYKGVLDRGFSYRGARIPFLNYQKGIYRAGVQRGPAALSIQTSYRSPYDDEPTDLGFAYAYRSGSVDQPDNRALRTAFALAVPLVYFVGVRPGRYSPEYPSYLVEDRPAERRVLVARGKMIGPMDEPEPVMIEDPLDRRYAVRETRVRLHQARFRGLVLPEYRDRCTVCRLSEVRLLDAAHIAGDLETQGAPIVPNGLSLCSIHHRAYDQNLVGISPDYEVQVAQSLLEDEDGPMLELLKGSQGRSIELPARKASYPDRDRLASRFEFFRGAA